jgi:hypothetical protein
MTETPETPTDDGSGPAGAGPARASGPVAELGLVAAGLGLVIYLIGFVADLGGVSSPILPLLLGGGLLAGTVALPTVRERVLPPAAVAITTGALLLIHEVVDDGGSVLAVGALVLGLLEAGAAVAATLLQAGVLRPRPPKARRSPESTFAGYPTGPQFPGQQYPGQPYPGAHPPGTAQPSFGDQWTGEHAYGQNAQYGGQYGVPGYPPPPPFGTPGHDPAPYREDSPAAPVAADDTGSHRAVPATGSFPAAADPPQGSGAHRQDAAGRRSDDDEHTRSLPVVPDER